MTGSQQPPPLLERRRRTRCTSLESIDTPEAEAAASCPLLPSPTKRARTSPGLKKTTAPRRRKKSNFASPKSIAWKLNRFPWYAKYLAKKRREQKAAGADLEVLVGSSSDSGSSDEEEAPSTGLTPHVLKLDVSCDFAGAPAEPFTPVFAVQSPASSARPAQLLSPARAVAAAVGRIPAPSAMSEIEVRFAPFDAAHLQHQRPAPAPGRRRPGPLTVAGNNQQTTQRSPKPSPGRSPGSLLRMIAPAFWREENEKDALPLPCESPRELSSHRRVQSAPF